MRGQGDPIKAVGYIQQLDVARCNGDWEAVPELVRKIRKHAPERTCLTLAAESAYTVAKTLKNRPATEKNWKPAELARLISPLLEVIEQEKTYVEDDFQARACLGWVHWVLGEPGLAASRLPGSVEQDFSQLEGTNKESTLWSKVCALQATYIKGSSLSSGGSIGDALEAFESAMPILSTVSPQLHTMAEMRHWTELLLTKFCMLSSHSIRNKLSPWLETETLTAFRSWADFWERQTVKGTRVLGGYAGEADVSRRQVWKEYYATLSFILEHHLPYPTSIMATAYSNPGTRLMQKAELERVGASYENLLLKEVQFPRAEQWNAEVEEWVNLVMKNWRVLCGPSWQEHELGAGGRQEVSRKVLDILYNAATKTFHSTQILRDLFTVHLAVADFDIAFKSFDTYLEIVKRSKSRVEKTGELEEGLDNDETVLQTTSECIRALCSYGTLNAGEKAKDLAHYLETWLEKHDPSFTQGDQVIEVQNGNSRLIENGHMTHGSPAVSPYIIAQTWRAIGISQAQWARLTYDANSRPDHQAKAIKNLRRALSPDYGRSDDTDTLYALALVLAERREVEQAIAVVKAALLPRQSSVTHAHSFPGRFARDISLIPLWHLLALLLSARQEFTTAARMCEGAFEQFKDMKNLFGDLEPEGNFQSEHLNRSLQEKSQPCNRGVIDDMDDFEKESILEVKITQLILTEIIDGSNAAVNASDELLSLYARLFDEPKALISAPPATTQTKPPSSSAGTLRSVKGSIFGRSRRSVRKPSGPPTAGSTIEENASLPSRPQTSQTAGSAPTQGPTIHVTAENGAASHKHRRRSQSTNPKTPQSRKESLTRKKSSTSMGKRIASASGQTSSPINDNETGSRPIPIISSMPQKEKTLKPSASGMQDTRLPELPPPLRAANPGVRFSSAQAKRHRIGILVRVWLLVAGFYRRAELYEDAKGAIDEAYKLVEAMELDVSQDDSGKVSIADAGWGFSKSVEEQWADVWAERGNLSSAKGARYTALADFEAALTHFGDHPAAIVGLSNILLDVYSEELQPPPEIPQLVVPTSSTTTSVTQLDTTALAAKSTASPTTDKSSLRTQKGPIGLSNEAQSQDPRISNRHPSLPQKAASTTLIDRIAARDRAYGLLSGLTKLGSGWNYSEAWFALARAYEEGGQLDKVREVLWWCIELEEGKGVRDWHCVGLGGYVL